MLEQQAFQQPTSLWQRNWMTLSPASMVGITGLSSKGAFSARFLKGEFSMVNLENAVQKVLI